MPWPSDGSEQAKAKGGLRAAAGADKSELTDSDATTLKATSVSSRAVRLGARGPQRPRSLLPTRHGRPPDVGRRHCPHQHTKGKRLRFKRCPVGWEGWVGLGWLFVLGQSKSRCGNYTREEMRKKGGGWGCRCESLAATRGSIQRGLLACDSRVG